MNIELIALIIFVLVLTLFIVINRKKIEMQKILFPFLYFILYKTKIGLKSMEKISKKERFIKTFNFASVFVGFLGMGVISALLIYNLYKLAFFPSAVSGVALVLPIKAKGVFFVPFFYWIISILVIAGIHEFCHGIIAKYHQIRIKSSGFAFLAILLPIIPAAFVEPDEKQLVKKKPKQQLQVFAAGPFSNIVLAFVILGIFALISTPI
ncbi:site-2 protease family protein, partial [Candidatus Woesearchaeota archaeon]|nr:site-2 protease family protein [Candidatus Woesearchaeota archaeon]